VDGPFPSRVDGSGSSDRRPAIDVARILALVVVVVGHLTIAVVDRATAGEVRGTNLLTLEPAWRWVAALAPMPVFFAAAGWANSTADLRSSARRLAAVVGTAAVVVVVWSSIVAVTWAAGGDETLVGRGARIATQPLWFLAAYVPLASMGRHVASLARNHMRSTVVVVVVALVGLDLARIGGDAPAWIGWACFPLAWGLPWLLGAWWRDRVETGRLNEQSTGVALMAGGMLVAAGLVAWAGYSVALIDTGADTRSNTTPPGLYTATAAVVQVGLLLTGASWLDRLGRVHRRLWDAAGRVAIGVYVWHLTALSLMVGLIAIGLAAPDRLTAAWWFTRPAWWAGVLGLTALLVAATAAGRIRLRRLGRPRPDARTGRLALGVVVATAGSALVGLEGPRDVALAAACTGAFLAAYRLLRVAEPDLNHQLNDRARNHDS
jgi:hypothetical protein